MIKQYDVFVGCYGSEEEDLIHWLSFDSDNGELHKTASISGIENPSFVTLHPSLNRLYAVSEVEKGQIVSYEIDFSNASLIELNRQSAHGHGPCYSEVKDSGFLFTANYGEGNVIVQPLTEAGTIECVTDIHDYSETAASLGVKSHPHTVRNIPGTNRYVVADLGTNRLIVYEFDEDQAKLVFVDETLTGDQSGPRHVTFHPSLPIIYVINELDSSILTYSFKQDGGSLKQIQKVKTIPNEYTGENYCADIHVAPSGLFLYASNRGHHSIASFIVSTDGTLRVLDNIPSGGEWPRSFVIVPDGKFLLVANEHTNQINIMRIHEDGLLSDTGKSYLVNRPVCVTIIDRESLNL
ncbi:Lactonase family protein [Sporosarcina sp. ANT_H38]|uniref:lactonase family protein n=1 Tax=Sporosarcina sp. ANT_H38 TaxID=2597358 RepID=UPI00165E58B0|nr:lactonase family protein [Sporosarcina sp. ANT_H38]